MIIILEGPNGSGKSTLFERLTKELMLSGYHPGSVPASVNDYYLCLAYQDVLKDVVLDRVSCISQMAYNIETMSIEEIKISIDYINSFIKKGARFIHCNSTLPFTEKSYYPKDHYKKINSKRDKIVANYLSIFSFIPHFKYDPLKQNYSEVYNYVTQY